MGRRERPSCSGKDRHCPFPMWTQTRKAFLPRYLLKMRAACFHWLGRQNKQTRKAVQRGGLCKTKPRAQPVHRG